MRILTLIENLVYQQGLVAEHGLSLYIETSDKKILFDTGQSGQFIQNAQKLGIDIEDVDVLVLSHGHYDHSGGLYPFLEINQKAKVYAKKSLFVPKFHGTERFIGIRQDDGKLRNRLVFVEKTTEIAAGFYLMPETRIFFPQDTHFEGMMLKQENTYLPDSFEDELFIAINQNEQISIVTACSHRGITNMVQTAGDYFKLPINLILGGFHIKNCTPAQFQHLANYLKNLQPASVGVCHCTGIDKYAELLRLNYFQVFYNFTGKAVQLI